MKQSPEDRIGLLGDIGVTGVGIGAGIGAGSIVAGAAGATTLFGSSTLGSILGGVFVTTTPVGWLIGGAAIAGGTAYGLTKLIKSGVFSNKEKEKNISELSKHIEEIEHSPTTQQAEKLNDEMIELITNIQKAVQIGYSQDKSNKLLKQVFNQKLSVEKANKLFKDYLNSH